MTLALENITVRYDDIVAVDRVSMTVQSGEIVALLGGSGSGKSSLLRAVAGLEPLADGDIRWAGDSIKDTEVHRRGIGMMFQDGQLFGHMSVGANIGYGLHSWPDRAAARRRVGDLLELVGLPGYSDRRIHELSGGQAQRVALARALAPEPKALLLDEPLSALDRGLREHLVGELRRSLVATKTTSLYVTHDQDEAFAVADRVAVLVAGQLIQVAAPETLWRSPNSRIVAEFLGYGPFIRPGTLPVTAAEPGGDLVGIGPEGLVEMTTGTDLPVISQQSQRGHVAVTVTLPDGQEATWRAPGRVGDQVRLGLDSHACVWLGNK